MKYTIPLATVFIGLLGVSGGNAAGLEVEDDLASKMRELYPPDTISNVEGFETNGFSIRSSNNAELQADMTPSGERFDVVIIDADDLFKVVIEKGRSMSTGGGVGIYHRDTGAPILTTGDRDGDGALDIVSYTVANDRGEAVREVVDYDADGQLDLRVHFEQDYAELRHQEQWYRIEEQDGVRGITVEGVFREVRSADGRPTVQ